MGERKRASMPASELNRLERWMDGKTALTVGGAQALMNKCVATDALRVVDARMRMRILSAMARGPEAWPSLGLKTRPSNTD